MAPVRSQRSGSNVDISCSRQSDCGHNHDEDGRTGAVGDATDGAALCDAADEEAYIDSALQDFAGHFCKHLVSQQLLEALLQDSEEDHVFAWKLQKVVRLQEPVYFFLRAGVSHSIDCRALWRASSLPPWRGGQQASGASPARRRSYCGELGL